MWSYNILCYDQQEVSDIPHFVQRQSHHILCHNQQGVSDIADFLEGSLITSGTMIHREWVKFHIFCKGGLSHLFLWPIGSQWHCRVFWKRVSSHIVLINRLWVTFQSFHKRSLITSCALTNRQWVTLHFFWYHVFLPWQTVCEWYSHSFENTISLLPVLWPTEGEYPYPFFWQSFMSILLYCKQEVSDKLTMHIL